MRPVAASNGSAVPLPAAANGTVSDERPIFAPASNIFLVSIGHETVMAQATFARCNHPILDISPSISEFEFMDEIDTCCDANIVVALKFERLVCVPKNSLFVASKLDTGLGAFQRARPIIKAVL